MLHQKISNLLKNRTVSDIHVEEGAPLWYREFGVLHADAGALLTHEDLVAFLSTLHEVFPDGSSIDERLILTGDKDFSASVGETRVRGNVFRANCGNLAFVLRRLSDTIPAIANLGLPDNFMDIANRSKGLFLVTGATGSGKSTTLAAIVEQINQSAQRHIITIEDPIEYRFSSAMSKVTQREVGKDASSFQNALRSALRQDPDVVMIGEMRDRITVQTALDAANTGHLVLATLHTTNARQSIERMVSFFSAEEKEWAHQVISSVLNGVLSQTLVADAADNSRVLCYEFLINTPAARQCIKDGKPQALYNVMETGRRDGQVLLNGNLIDRVRQGRISFEDAQYATYDPVALEKEMSGDY